MKSFKVNGVALTESEINLLQMGDVEDTNELRDVAALRARMDAASIMSKRPLQAQIDALQGSAERANVAKANQTTA